MRKIEIVGKIDQFNPETGEFHGYVSSMDRGLMKGMFDFVGQKQWKLILGKYYRRWTTGDKSQNHHIFGHGTELATFTGQSVKSFLYESAERAFSKGYPPKDNAFGKIVPIELEELDTMGAAILIEQLHEDAAFLSCILTEF